MVEIRIVARCFPTEDRTKVVDAVLGFFPDARVEGDDPLIGIASSVDAFGELLGRQQIRGAARVVMRRGMTEGRTTFRLNKQVATVGKASFAQEEHPLGDIEVTISDKDIERVIDSLAPDTRRPVSR
jgi:hypothetical protein